MATVSKVKQSLTRRLTEIMVAGQLLVLTPNHPLQTASGDWLPAEHIQQGTLLNGANGPTQVESVCTEAVPPTTVYSLVLENDLPYYVGQAPVLAFGSCDLRTIYSVLTDAQRADFKTLVRQINNAGGDYGTFINKLAENAYSSSQITELRTSISSLSNTKLKAFADDFGSIASFFKTETANRVKAWNSLSAHAQVRKDPDILLAAFNFVKNQDDFIRANPNQFENIINGLVNEVFARCKSCANKGTNLGIPTIDVIVENMDWALTRFKNSNVDIQKLFAEMASQGSKADGGAFMLNVLRTKSDNYLNSISRFEYKYLTTGDFEADIVRSSNGVNVLEEYKSYTSGSWNWFPTNQSSIDQLGAYISSGDDFYYFANVMKLQNVTNPLEFVKKKFQTVFKAQNYKFYDDLVSSQPNAFSRFGITNKRSFIDKVNDLDSTFYSFILVL